MLDTRRFCVILRLVTKSPEKRRGKDDNTAAIIMMMVIKGFVGMVQYN